LLEDGAVAVGKTIGWSVIANRAVQENLVVMVNKVFGNALCITEGQGCFVSDSKDKKLLFTPRHDFFSLDAGALKSSWAGASLFSLMRPTPFPTPFGEYSYWCGIKEYW
jgi:hypothetical protein